MHVLVFHKLYLQVSIWYTDTRWVIKHPIFPFISFMLFYFRTGYKIQELEDEIFYLLIIIINPNEILVLDKLLTWSVAIRSFFKLWLSLANLIRGHNQSLAPLPLTHSWISFDYMSQIFTTTSLHKKESSHLLFLFVP